MRKSKEKADMVISAKLEGVKYAFLLGEHYLKGHSCFDIASVNMWTGEVLKVHFKDKAESLARWNKLMQDYKAMEERRSHEGADQDESKLVIL